MVHPCAKFDENPPRRFSRFLGNEVKIGMIWDEISSDSLVHASSNLGADITQTYLDQFLDHLTQNLISSSTRHGAPLGQEW